MVNLGGGDEAYMPQWSPNGLFIEFQNLARGSVMAINALSGTVSTLFSWSGIGNSITWAPDSGHLLTVGGPNASGPISVVNLAGQVTETTGTSGMDASWIRVEGGPSVGSAVVGIAATSSGLGYRIVTSDGGILSYGQGLYYGSMGGLSLNRPIVASASTPDHGGYWEVASDGGIFSFGDAAYYGSMGGVSLNQPIVGMAATPTGKGYWLVAKDGGIFSFGDAGFLGSMGGISLNKPVVGMADTPSGRGYWLVASDGGIFSYGDAAFYGSTGSLRLNEPTCGMSGVPGGGAIGWLHPMVVCSRSGMLGSSVQRRDSRSETLKPSRSAAGWHSYPGSELGQSDALYDLAGTREDACEMFQSERSKRAGPVALPVLGQMQPHAPGSPVHIGRSDARVPG